MQSPPGAEGTQEGAQSHPHCHLAVQHPHAAPAGLRSPLLAKPQPGTEHRTPSGRMSQTLCLLQADVRGSHGPAATELTRGPCPSHSELCRPYTPGRPPPWPVLPAPQRPVQEVAARAAPCAALLPFPSRPLQTPAGHHRWRWALGFHSPLGGTLSGHHLLGTPCGAVMGLVPREGKVPS